MTLFDIINLNREFLSRLREAGARLDDIDYLGLYAEFTRMVAAGHKVTYAVSVLAQRHGVSPRTVYAVVGRLKKPLQH